MRESGKGIDTQEVLAAAGTKWNFLPFRPGLVGGPAPIAFDELIEVSRVAVEAAKQARG